MTDPEAKAGPAAPAAPEIAVHPSEVNPTRSTSALNNQDTAPLNNAGSVGVSPAPPRTAVVLTAPPPAKGASEYEDNDEDDLHSISSQSTRGGHHSDTHAAWDPFASNLHAPEAASSREAPTNPQAPVPPADNQSEVYMPGTGGVTGPFVPPKVVMPFAPMQGPMVDHTGEAIYMPNAGGYNQQLPQQPQPTVPPLSSAPPAYAVAGDGAGRPGMYKPSAETGGKGEKAQRSCSFGRLYWACACILFLVPLGLIIGFIFMSSRLKIVAMEAKGVNSTISSPDTKAFLMTVEVKLKVANNNKVGVNITNLNVNAAIPPPYGGLLGAKQLGSFSQPDLIMVKENSEKIIPITIPLRFDADSDPEWKSLMEVVKSCGLVGGGLRPFSLKVTTSALGKVVGKDVAFKTSDSLDVACPIPSDFKSDLLTQLAEKHK